MKSSQEKTSLPVPEKKRELNLTLAKEIIRESSAFIATITTDNQLHVLNHPDSQIWSTFKTAPEQQGDTRKISASNNLQKLVKANEKEPSDNTFFTLNHNLDSQPTKIIKWHLVPSKNNPEIKLLYGKEITSDCLDQMTNLGNRRLYDGCLEEIKQSSSMGTIGFIDINGLKKVNDTHKDKHKAGDRLIQTTAAFLQKVFRSDDLLFRIGGDEFTVLLPYLTHDERKNLKKRIKKEMKEWNKEHPENQISFSFAFANWGEIDSEGNLVDIYSAVMKADRKMMKAKNKYKEKQAEKELKRQHHSKKHS